MKDVRVGLLLTLTIFVMAAIPLAAAFYLFQGTLRTSLDLGFNQQIARALDNSSANLRTLGRLDEQNRANYRAQFDEVEELKQVYSDPQFLKQRLLDSLQWYFGLGLGAVVLLSVGVASLLSRRIARGHAIKLDELSRERDKVRYLQEMASWQELARMLAHEIKNPLTPIEVLVTSLSRAYLSKGQPEFLAHLTETQAMISEELQHLKATVNKFSEFARLPQAQLAVVELVAELDRQLKSISNLADTASFEVRAPENRAMRVRLDVTLFRLALANIISNGIEANPQRRVRFTLSVAQQESNAILRIANDGVPVSSQIADRIFDPYISTKSGKDNMGLGLAIVKKIVLEHGGDVRYEERDGQPAFVLSLPLASP